MHLELSLRKQGNYMHYTTCISSATKWLRHLWHNTEPGSTCRKVYPYCPLFGGPIAGLQGDFLPEVIPEFH